MPAFRAVWAIRVVADAAALDAAAWTEPETGQVTVLRVAPDEAIAINALGASVPDGDAIATQEGGLVVGHCSLDEIEHFLEWPLPAERPAFAQGAVAGVPVRLMLDGSDLVALYTWAAYADDLAAKLGWLR